MPRDRRKVGGYAWNKEMDRANQANNTARATLRAIANHIQHAQVSPLLIAQLLTQAALALAENQAALRELDKIARRETNQ